MRDTGTERGLRRHFPLLAAVVGAFVLMILVAALQGHPVFSLVDFGSAERTPPPQEMVTMPPDEAQEQVPQEPNGVVTLIATILGIAIGTVLLLLLIRQLIRIAKALWAARQLERMEGDAPVDAVAESVAVDGPIQAPVVREGIDAALDFIDERPIPSDAIIAAWVGLESSAERAGQRRGAAETPGEFTVRVVGRRPAAAAELQLLLRLYERVRFGGYHALEEDRTQARELLRDIRRVWE